MTLDYSDKQKSYFSNARTPFVALLPDNPEGRLLEIGCGSGDTAALARIQHKCGWACGVELFQEAADQARHKLDCVLVGDVEKLPLEFPDESFDTLLLSEVLEHLVDPWALLRRLRRLMKPNAIIVAGSPNVCHYSVIVTLVKGQWRYESSGIFDRTHLRWFTPLTYRQMFVSSGFTVLSSAPAYPLSWKARLFDRLTAGRLRHLLHTQIVLQARCP